MSFRSYLVGLGSLVVLVAAACSDEDLFETGDQTSSNASSGGATASSASNSGSGSGGQAACVDLGDACTKCELSACPDRYCACYGNVSCGLLASCALACPVNDYACWQACYEMHPDGISDGALLVHCAATECPMGCPGYVPLDPCSLCLYEKCPSQMNKCVANADCSLTLVCLQGCNGDELCNNDCYAMYPNGLSDVGAVGTCSVDNCSDVCG
jgi:hypothetical protein